MIYWNKSDIQFLEQNEVHLTSIYLDATWYITRILHVVKLKITYISSYNQMRGEMILSMRQITHVEQTADVLFFDAEAVSDEINSSIFKAVQKYLKLSKRHSH